MLAGEGSFDTSFSAGDDSDITSDSERPPNHQISDCMTDPCKHCKSYCLNTERKPATIKNFLERSQRSCWLAREHPQCSALFHLKRRHPWFNHPAICSGMPSAAFSTQRAIQPVTPTMVQL